VEDPLRVLRGMQLASRFDLTAAAETIALCRSIKNSFHELARERVREEWFKWAGESVRPSKGLRFLRDTEWVEHFPEIRALAGTPQDPEWHPEGDVFTHTCHGCDALAGLPEWRETDTESRVVYMLATLAHDFGKPTTTSETILAGRRRIVSPGHEEAGCPLARSFLRRMMSPQRIEDRVANLVGNHLFHIHGSITDRSVRRLARRLHPETIEGLCIVMTADHFGRPPKPKAVPESIRQLRKMAQAMSLQAAAPKPVLMGRHLIELGMKPGPEFKVVLDAAFESQLDGSFADLVGAMLWLSGQDQLPLTGAIRQELANRISRASNESSQLLNDTECH
jgi:tRNA nucleotidyltransferase (CCA-adding enzyme)